MSADTAAVSQSQPSSNWFFDCSFMAAVSILANSVPFSIMSVRKVGFKVLDQSIFGRSPPRVESSKVPSIINLSIYFVGNSTLYNLPLRASRPRIDCNAPVFSASVAASFFAIIFFIFAREQPALAALLRTLSRAALDALIFLSAKASHAGDVSMESK